MLPQASQEHLQLLDCGHLVFAEWPVEWADLIKGFLTETGNQ